MRLSNGLAKCQEPGDIIFYSPFRAHSLPAFGGIANLKFQSWVAMPHAKADAPILRVLVRADLVLVDFDISQVLFTLAGFLQQVKLEGTSISMSTQS